MFDRVIIADWSAANCPTSARRLENAIWIGECDGQGGVDTHHRTRASAEAALGASIAGAVQAGRRLLIGFDFAMGYPQGFAARLTGSAGAPGVWHWLAQHITDTGANTNNRFAVAAAINARFGGPGPFWSHPAGQSHPGLPTRKAGIDYAALGLAEFRGVESVARGAKPVWMLFNPGAVGSQSLLGLPMIHRLSQRPGVAVWPYARAQSPVVLAEVYPSLLGKLVAAEGGVKDRAQVRLLARALWRLGQGGGLAGMLDIAPSQALADEGWILGAGHGAELQAVLA